MGEKKKGGTHHSLAKKGKTSVKLPEIMRSRGLKKAREKDCKYLPSSAGKKRQGGILRGSKPI